MRNSASYNTPFDVFLSEDIRLNVCLSSENIRIYAYFIVDNVSMFRENLRKMMKARGMSAKELAEKIETDEDRQKNVMLYRIIENYTGKRASMPSAERAVAIAQALGTSVEALVTGEDRSLLPERLRPIIRDLSILDDADLKELEAIISVKLSRYQENTKHA